MLEELRRELLGRNASKVLLYRIATNLGSCAMQLDEPDVAIKEIDEAFQLDPENPKAITNAAAVSLQRGQPEQALALAEKARGKLAQDSFATSNYIQALFALGRESELPGLVDSEAWIQKDALCTHVIGTLLFNRGRFGESEKYFRIALEADSENPQI